MSGISATSIVKLGKGANVNTEVLLKICNALNCDVGDIMEFVADAEEAQKTTNIETVKGDKQWQRKHASI